MGEQVFLIYGLKLQTNGTVKCPKSAKNTTFVAIRCVCLSYKCSKTAQTALAELASCHAAQTGSNVREMRTLLVICASMKYFSHLMPLSGRKCTATTVVGIAVVGIAVCTRHTRRARTL